MPLPSLTDLQFLVIESLLDGDRSGRQVREYMGTRGARKSGPAFYQLMSRLEDAGLVEGRYDDRDVAGHRLKERVYKLIGAGRRAYEQTIAFYSLRSLQGGFAN